MIRLATVDDLSNIEKLLNYVTLDLHKKGVEQWNYPWTLNSIDGLYIIEKDEVIIGTFSIMNLSDNMTFPLGNKKDLYLHTIAIHPSYQGNNLGLNIIQYVNNISETLGVDIYLDCWNGNSNLKRFYSNAGLDICGVFPEDDYEICIFRF